ncbi:MAG: response regulator [Phycisphaerae bacterium]|nr:response regulator [Phycisphaerae bacterium]
MVLVIDDDPTLAPLVSGLLSAGGEGHLDVVAAPTLAAGIDVFRGEKEPPCVILLDLRLPDSDGLATLAACREVCKNDSPIVVLTADGDRSLAVAALREGADDFLLKTELTAQTLARALRYSIERTQHRSALEAAEARAGAVLRSIDSMIGIVGSTGRLLEVNEAWRTFAIRTGCPVMNAVAGIDFIAFCRGLGHAFADVVVGAIEALLCGATPRFEEVVSGMPPCGSQVHLRLRACTVDLPQGRGVALVLDDFTEKVGFERELNDYAQRMAVAIEAGHVGTFSYDLASGRVEWSPWHFRILGIEPGGFDGTLTGFLRFVHPEDRDRIVAQMEASRESREPIRSAYRVVRPDGAIRFVEGEARYSYDPAGRAFRLSGAIADVTERRVASARQGLSQRLEALGELSTGIAHDLRNTLSLAHAAIARLEEAQIEDSACRTAVADLRLVTQQAGQLVGSLVQFARPHRDGPTPVVDLNETSLHFVSFLRRLLPTSLRVRVECGSESAPIAADPIHIQQVLMNLVLNARDALRGEGEVCVRVLPGMRFHQLEVADNGPGISESDQAHLFEPFFRGRSDGEGSGLGLAIVKTILESSSASITVESEPGCGSLFRIQWPAAVREDGRTLLSRPATTIEPKLVPIVMLVQPEGYARRILADGLSELGYEVKEVADLETVCQSIESSASYPAVIVVDEERPGEQFGSDGATSREGLRRLRDLGCPSPAILVTSCMQMSDDDEYLVLPKPYSVGQVCAAVRAVLDEDVKECEA